MECQWLASHHPLLVASRLKPTFADVALQVSKAVLPRYRSRFSKRLFNQRQLLAILYLMRYEDWTFREAEVRLGEHRELR
jgi:hypothetical protein